ncbi:MAG: epoxyqueuosine reductase QueH [Patescibacteria group bacterium]|nr:epoxyqueuosine reductase QueH [Patescibacteria group bacterium]
MKRILLHTCCAPCGAYVMEQLQKQGYTVAVFFTNDNIYPREEYEKRKNEIKKYCTENKIEFWEDEYQPEEWSKIIKGLENEPEGKKRCEVCFRYRLEKTAQKAKENNFDFFGSTLTISPHKNSATINAIGKEVGEKISVPFLVADWKENNGFKCSCEISRANNFYRQNYCGCQFSIRNAN